MSMTTGARNIEQIDKKVKEVFIAGANGYNPMYNKVFNIETPERFDERYTTTKTDAAVLEVADGGAFPTQPIVEIGANQITQRIFKSAIQIGDVAELFDNYGAIERTAQTRGYQMVAKIDILGADILNNSTSTSAPYGINIAGTTTSLFSTTQPIGDSGDTQSNRVSGDLDKTTLNSAYVAMRKMKDHDGMIAGFQARRLVVPMEEFQNAWQICMSRGEPESANRNDNFSQTLGLEIIPWQQLSSTTACFLLADKGMMQARGLRYPIKEMPTIRRLFDTKTGTHMYTFRMFVAPGLTDYQGCVSIGL